MLFRTFADQITLDVIMPTRAATPAEERMVTAYHEAGHLTATVFCEYFGLRDPAVELNLTGRFSALSGAKKLKPTTEPDAAKESVREFVRIALSGRAAERELEARTTAAGQRLIAGPDGANHDLLMVKNTLKAEGMEGELKELERAASELIDEKWNVVEQIAALLMKATEDKVSRQAILSLPALQDDV